MNTSGNTGIAGLGLGAGAFAILALAGSASAGVVPALTPGMYPMLNHPDGSAQPPAYGLRLDELHDVSGGHDKYTFDFQATGVLMMLTLTNTGPGTYDANLSGTAYGGLDIGSGYDANDQGMVAIDFTYSGLTIAPGDDDLIFDGASASNSGTIEWLTGPRAGTIVDLFDKSDGNYTFRLGDEDDDNGHRGYNGVSGWGWLSVGSPSNHVAAMDWLFRLPPDVPTPGTTALLATAGLVTLRRRRG